MNPIFNELDIRLSSVPRWSILLVHRRQSVAEHLFNTERLAVGMARHWFKVTDQVTLFEISQLALHHDDVESLLSDPPSIIKDLVDEEAAKQRYVDLLRPPVQTDDVCKAIVKLADVMEAYLWLRVEMSMGNHSVDRIKDELENRVENLLEHCQQFTPINLHVSYSRFLDSLFHGENGALISLSYDRRPKPVQKEAYANNSIDEEEIPF